MKTKHRRERDASDVMPATLLRIRVNYHRDDATDNVASQENRAESGKKPRLLFMLRSAASGELHAAVERGDTGTIERLVSEGASVNEPHEVRERRCANAFRILASGWRRRTGAPRAIGTARHPLTPRWL